MQLQYKVCGRKRAEDGDGYGRGGGGEGKEVNTDLLIGKFNCILFRLAHSLHSDLLSFLGSLVLSGSCLWLLHCCHHFARAHNSVYLGKLLSRGVLPTLYLERQSAIKQGIHSQNATGANHGVFGERASNCDDRRRTDLVKPRPHSKHCGRILLFSVNETKTLHD